MAKCPLLAQSRHTDRVGECPLSGVFSKFKSVTSAFDLKRHEFITLVGGAAAWPLTTRAESALPVVAFIFGGSANAFAPHVVAFRKGLSEAGSLAPALRSCPASGVFSLIAQIRAVQVPFGC